MGPGISVTSHPMNPLLDNTRQLKFRLQEGCSASYVCSQVSLSRSANPLTLRFFRRCSPFERLFYLLTL
ncbi:hypothetical protein E2C01_025332 [Portunus trituberculatus]|uniref:Uncharacterized protein n=1 Tax=Portunus trituberculatus TaxID=210409 RepID=A0A5B7ECP0_PORTR|nr:hypothetical protein [Portunus trituberculatus]